MVDESGQCHMLPSVMKATEEGLVAEASQQHHHHSPRRAGSSTIKRFSKDFNSLTISWRGVDVFCRTRQKSGKAFFKLPTFRSDSPTTSHAHILKNVSGVCRPGELLAIMGASGAGKTTLLNVLTHRNNDKLRVTGDLFVNGRRVDPDGLTSRSAYVQQDDLFIGILTVLEQLVFQAMLRMAGHLSKEERLRRVDQVITEFGLTSCENSRIGTRGKDKSISGGEMKRLSFACEVLTNPPLMFCDEPTSGLDSFMAQNVVAVMKSMAENGKTIIFTIHQPSSEAYSMFDRVLLMAEGRVAFLGPADEAFDFFTKMDLPCPRQHNPADHFLEQLSVDPGRRGRAGEDMKRVNQLCDAFEVSEWGMEMAEDVAANQRTLDKAVWACGEGGGGFGRYRSGWAWQLQWVTWRAWLQVLREPYLVRVRFIQLLMLALLLGTIFRGQKRDKVGAFNINGALFLMLTSITFQNVSTVINTFCSDREVFHRDHQSGMYRPSIYFLAHSLIQAPVFTLSAVLYTALVYYLMELNPDPNRFAMCVLVVVLVTWCSVSFGYLLSCAAPSLNAAFFMLGPLLLPLMLFSGFLLNMRSVPSALKVVQYLSWFTYGNKILIVNQWAGVTNFSCTHGHSCYPDGEAIIAHFGFSESPLSLDLVCLAGLSVLYRVVAFGFFLLRTRRSQIQATDAD